MMFVWTCVKINNNLLPKAFTFDILKNFQILKEKGIFIILTTHF